MKELKELTENKLITETLSTIETFCGLSLKPCDCFPGIHKHAGKKYFNVMLNERCSCSSREMLTLERLVANSIIAKFEPNGLARVAIYFNQ